MRTNSNQNITLLYDLEQGYKNGELKEQIKSRVGFFAQEMKQFHCTLLSTYHKSVVVIAFHRTKSGGRFGLLRR